MKTDWEVKTLGEVCSLRSGTTLHPSLEKPHGELPYLKVADMNLDENKNHIITSSRFVDTIDVNKATIIPIGSTIFPKRGGAILTNKKRMTSALICMDLNLMAVSSNGKILPAYLFYYFLNLDLRDINNGSSIPQINNYQIEPLEIAYPESLPEQQRIVAILDEAFAAIDKAKENAQKNLQNARELFDSYLQSVFANPGEDWEKCKIEDYIKFIDYRGRTPEKTEEGIRLITAKNVKLGYLQRSPEEFINPENYNSWMTRGIPRIGDVLFTTEAPLANVAQLDTDEKVAFAQRIIILQTQAKKLNNTFLKYLLLSAPIRKKIIEQGTGATVQGIKASLLKKIEIYFPATISEQEAIVTKFDALSVETKKLEAIYQQKLTDLDELKKAILQKAFRGELTATSADAVTA